MERSAWTDRRLDDRFDRIDTELAEIRTDIRELRGELNARIDALNARIDALGSELRAAILRTNLTMMVGFLGLLAAVLARGG